MAEIVQVKDLVLGDILSFNLYGGGAVNNVANGKLVAITGGDVLRDPTLAAVNHANVYPSIPENLVSPVPNDFSLYNYLTIKLANDDIVEIGVPWVITDSLLRQTRHVVKVTLTDFDTTRLPILKEALTTYGFLNPSIEVLDP